jgi:hypothetical protein
MDDYLFIVLAKLKADRLKLEREARAESSGRHAFDDEFGQLRESHSRRARRLGAGSQGFQRDLWGEQS